MFYREGKIMVRFLPWALILIGAILMAASIFYLSQGEGWSEAYDLSYIKLAPTFALSPSPVSITLTYVATQLAPEATPTPAPKPVRIVIPAIGVDAPVVEVGMKIVYTEKGPKAEWETAEYAAGHHSTSASPGEKGNIVISGHNNIKGKVFQRLWELKPGDRVFLYNAADKLFVYEVKEVLLLKEKGVSEEQRRANARYMEPTPDETLTLISCWPPRGNSHRVIVIAKPVKPPTYQGAVE